MNRSIHIKTPAEIEMMRQGGKILKRVVDEIVPYATVGIATSEIDDLADKLLRQYGADISFKTVPGYSWATCLPVNEQAVHTPPSNYRLQDGDILTIDIGALFQGYHTDYAVSLLIGDTVDEKKVAFLRTGSDILEEAIRRIKEGVHLGEIGSFIHHEMRSKGYFILKQLTGHGIGKQLHEDPYVLNYASGPVERTYRVRNGLTIAVEIIYSMGTEKIAYESEDKWSIITADRSLSACFEHTIAIIDGIASILV